MYHRDPSGNPWLSDEFIYLRDNDPKTFFWRHCGNDFLFKRKAPVELIRMRYFFQSMGYNPLNRRFEWIEDFQDCSSEWERTKMTANGGLWYKNKEIWIRNSDWNSLRQLQENTGTAPKNNVNNASHLPKFNYQVPQSG